jgi:hypothetical protein
MNSPVVGLLSELRSRGVKIGAQNGLIWYEPKSSVDADLLDRLRQHKPTLLALLRADAPRCGRCGTREFVDVSIHGGRSVRRDCAGCGRFLDFSVWYGKKTDRFE